MNVSIDLALEVVKLEPTPADANCNFSRDDCPTPESDEALEMKGLDYRGIVGCLLYIAKQTRPGNLATVSKLSPFLENPGKVHWTAVKRVLRYLKGTRELVLTFVRDEYGLLLRGSCDADCASDTVDRRSTTGYAFKFQ